MEVLRKPSEANDVADQYRVRKQPFYKTVADEESLYEAIGRGNTQECILMPMLNHNEVIAILYGDNAETGRPLGKLRGLELFFAQAGMALENLSLHRKLRFFESMLSREQREIKQGQGHV